MKEASWGCKQKAVWYALNLYNAVCQVYLNKNERKNI